MIVLPCTDQVSVTRQQCNAEHRVQLNNGTDITSSSVSAVAAVVPPAQVLCTFMDGGVGIYDLSKRRWNFLRELVSVVYTV